MTFVLDPWLGSAMKRTSQALCSSRVRTTRVSLMVATRDRQSAPLHVYFVARWRLATHIVKPWNAMEALICVSQRKHQRGLGYDSPSLSAIGNPAPRVVRPAVPPLLFFAASNGRV